MPARSPRHHRGPRRRRLVYLLKPKRLFWILDSDSRSDISSPCAIRPAYAGEIRSPVRPDMGQLVDQRRPVHPAGSSRLDQVLFPCPEDSSFLFPFLTFKSVTHGDSVPLISPRLDVLGNDAAIDLTSPVVVGPRQLICTTLAIPAPNLCPLCATSRIVTTEHCPGPSSRQSVQQPSSPQTSTGRIPPICRSRERETGKTGRFGISSSSIRAKDDANMQGTSGQSTGPK